jgi:hypothetical protein
MTSIPDEITVNIRPSAVLRSVLAYIAAAKRVTDDVTLDAAIRLYLQGGELDPEIRVYLWPYPYYEIVVARDFQFVDHVNGYSLDGTASVMKFFPLAFMATDAGTPLPFDRLDQYAALPITAEVAYDINLRMVMNASWPERPDRMQSVVGGAAFVDAISSIDGRFGGRHEATTAVEPSLD